MDRRESETPSPPPAVSSLIVRNFKSLASEEPLEIEVRPLTLLAGANSSGKSSAVQPILLLKQTLESSFDPGPLRLDGSHVKFTSTEQIRPKRGGDEQPFEIEIGLQLGADTKAVSSFRAVDPHTFELTRTTIDSRGHHWVLSQNGSRGPALREESVEIRRERCFYGPELGRYVGSGEGLDVLIELDRGILASVEAIQSIIHVRGLRGTPQRTYPITAVGPIFPGPFEPYVASLLQGWERMDGGRLEELGSQLEDLGLTWKVEAQQLTASEVEVRVGRLPRAAGGGVQDLVNIADVGFGVSQTLPVLVALLAAEPGQLVFLEQPEIHLHPKAQVALARVLADAAGRGVRVIAETHSVLLLTAIQALVAEGELPPEKVLLHWFERDEKGITRITTRELDEQGRYGDWPEDFAETELEAQSRYLDAVEKRLRAVGDE